MANLNFRISSALKDIIGRDLITDDFTAVFELVKNSYDADATRVDIIFENLATEKPIIIIKDNGKGMDYSDLKDRWLFVAYSAKRDGTEDIDYRDKIHKNRLFAGAKGIGRFSCDRLGSKLQLESTRRRENRTEILQVDWEKFEMDLEEEFVNIEVKHTWKQNNSYNLKHGTVLEITDLRSTWDRNKLIRLKDSIAKLINPSKNDKDFRIFLQVPDEIEADEGEVEYFMKVNGEVQNFIFEALELKTTQITSVVSKDGNNIVSELRDGGTFIYRIKEKNSFKLLKDISYQLFYLNQSAKLTFARRMGVSTVNYGSVSLYKNGFRIYPFGEPGEDTLGLDKRKAQGYRRFLGTRDLIGRIEISGANNDLRETSSRGDGLIKTPSYEQLVQCFFDKTLKRLERYVVDVQKWGLSIEENLDPEDRDKLKLGLLFLFTRLTDSSDLIDIEYGDNILEIISSNQKETAEAVIKNLKKIATESGNDKLLAEAIKAENRLKELYEALIETEAEAELAKKSIKEKEAELKLIRRENLLLKEATNADTVELMSVEHHINQVTNRIQKSINKLITAINSGSSQQELLLHVNKISLENSKIASLIKFVRKANFDSMSSSIIQDLGDYIYQYVENIYKEDKIKIINNELIEVEVEYNKDQGDGFLVEFVPLEINIIIDNLLDNSYKAKATKVKLSIHTIHDHLEVKYSDNGIGIPDEDLSKVFDFGFSTTSGSGIGLHHIQDIVENSYGGKISVNNKPRVGVEFMLILKGKKV